jgi:hypothetical protein
MQDAPSSVSVDVLESGAQIYNDHVLVVDTPAHDASYAKQMYPPPPQMWKMHGTHGAVGVSEFETGMTYWIVSNGIRLSGMPSFTHLLTDADVAGRSAPEEHGQRATALGYPDPQRTDALIRTQLSTNSHGMRRKSGEHRDPGSHLRQGHVLDPTNGCIRIAASSGLGDLIAYD